MLSEILKRSQISNARYPGPGNQFCGIDDAVNIVNRDDVEKSDDNVKSDVMAGEVILSSPENFAEIHVSKDMLIMFENTDFDLRNVSQVKITNMEYYYFFGVTSASYMYDKESINLVKGLLMYAYIGSKKQIIATTYVHNNFAISIPTVSMYYGSESVDLDHVMRIDETNINMIESSGISNKKIYNLMLNSLLYFQSHPDWIQRVQLPQKETTGKMGKRKREQIAIENNHSVIHKISVPKQIRNCIRAKDFEGPISKINKRFMVRGHWRQQACGKRQSERKLTFIAPFWKGPEDAPLIEHVYEVN